LHLLNMKQGLKTKSIQELNTLGFIGGR